MWHLQGFQTYHFACPSTNHNNMWMLIFNSLCADCPFKMIWLYVAYASCLPSGAQSWIFVIWLTFPVLPHCHGTENPLVQEKLALVIICLSPFGLTVVVC